MAQDIKNLPPEDRIRKLKEIEEKKKKEIAQAKKLIKESEDELTERKKWVDKVPLPQVAQDDLTGLSESAKDILGTHRGVKRKEDSEEEPESKDVSLEETVDREAIELPKQVQDVRYQLPHELSPQQINAEYLVQQSTIPVQELRAEMESLYKGVEDKGYMTWQEQRRANVIYSAIDEKMRAVESGKYSMAEDVAAEASLAKRLTGRLLDNAYQANKSGGAGPQNWYKGN